MAIDPSSQLTFTKLVVDDLEGMAAYYCEVFGLHVGYRHRFEDGVGGESIEELSLKASPEDEWGNLTLLKFIERTRIAKDEAILGFTTTDLDALLQRVERAGGRLVGKLKNLPEQSIRVAFSRDPEGHLSEMVEVQP